MFSVRMAIKPHLALTRLLLWTTALAPLAAADHYYYPAASEAVESNNGEISDLPRLADDVASVVPICAQECFRSFVKLSYKTTQGCDSGAPSLACLCAQQGELGFTAGEGAIQCLVGGQSAGICSESDAAIPRLNMAYNMCTGVQGAASPTHSTIVATLEFDSGSRVIIPTPTSVGSQVTTMPNIEAPATTTLLAPTSQADPTDSATTSKQPEEQGGAPAPKSSSNKLNQGQVAGLSIGLISAVGLAIGAIFLARYRRKKHYPDTETRFFMRNEKLNAWSTRFSRARGDSISAPLHGTAPMKLEESPPKQFPMSGYAPGYTPTEWRPESVGMALTNGVQPVNNIPSRAGRTPPLPAGGVPPAVATRSPKSPSRKPMLSLTIPQNASPIAERSITKPAPAVLANAPPSRNSRPRSQPSDASTPRTEFEEDGHQSLNASQIWRPPSATPQSATAVYVADRYGNWVLADERQMKRISVVELEGSTPNTKTAAEKVRDEAALASATAALKVNNKERALAPAAEITSKVELNRSTSVASSIYSQNSDATPWVSDAPPLPTNPLFPPPLMPKKYDPSASAASNNNGYLRPQKAKKAVYSPIQNPFLDDSRLSPVAESPSSRGSKRTPPLGPGQYKLPANPKDVRTPTRPDKRMQLPPTSPTEPISPPGQPSPTLGVADLATPRRNQGITPPPRPAMGPSPSPPSAEYASRTQRGSPAPRNRPNLAPPNRASPSSPSPNISPISPAQRLPHIAYLESHPPEKYPSSALLAGQASGSLLAKRLGNQRAAGMALDPASPGADEKRRKAQWQKQMSPSAQQVHQLLYQQSQPSQPQQPYYSEQSPQAATQQGIQGNFGALRVDTKIDRASRQTEKTTQTAKTLETASTWDGSRGGSFGGGSGMELPSTPTWKPKLTLARRGDDLYMNVQ